ncbi:hypothetical protein DMH01_03495 [Amycolatopsis sp. WAC 04182]|uniref:hypothetical protein n=1 Tax=Amycolatopsis sp. WAC 04182 TaxID=2203198 RepID=UPI000F7846C0|nr:hypothetical protein [Amycolatopsis sp. WAC 04182]RSN65454.1 hypothetical protein DMH01_03495 [Amycolatopsis sp. WAC 04182]
MISSKCLTDPRHAMPAGSEDYPAEHPHNVHRVYARATETAAVPGGMRLPTPSVHGMHRVIEPGDTMPLPRLESMANSSFELAAQLGAMGADCRFAKVERSLCVHCQMRGHYATVRLYPLPDPHQPNARQTVPNACACCAPGVLSELQSESSGRAPIVVEVWHPKAEA